MFRDPCQIPALPYWFQWGIMGHGSWAQWFPLSKTTWIKLPWGLTGLSSYRPASHWLIFCDETLCPECIYWPSLWAVFSLFIYFVMRFNEFCGILWIQSFLRVYSLCGRGWWTSRSFLIQSGKTLVGMGVRRWMCQRDSLIRDGLFVRGRAILTVGVPCAVAHETL